MQTLIAYARRDSSVDVDAGIARVSTAYTGAWTVSPQLHRVDAASCGLALWDAVDSTSRWPAWQACDSRYVASLYAPLGFEKVIGSTSLDGAPLALAEQLRRHPEAILDLTPPFVLTSLNSTGDSLRLHTDALGVGRLFEVATPWGWVWSNRPVAALRFADLAATADPRGWRQSAVADEFFGEATPYAGVRTIDAATTISWDNGRILHSTIDIAAAWASVGSSASHRQALLEGAAESLQTVAASVSRLYGGHPSVDLSGGRDSRLVAASFVAACADITLHSHDAVPGDLDTATALVAALPTPPRHITRHLPTGGKVLAPPFPALPRARAWHDYAEGLRPCTFLGYLPPAGLDADQGIAVGGVGGEIAHGFFYPGDVEKVLAMPEERRLRRFAAAVVTRQAPVPGASLEARTELVEYVLEVLRGIAARGYSGATVLDVYYMRERLRRWGTTAEKLGTVSPLLSPAFIQAALAMTPQERRGNTLHRQIIKNLIPAWAELPFFPAETAATAPPHGSCEVCPVGRHPPRRRLGRPRHRVPPRGQSRVGRSLRRPPRARPVADVSGRRDHRPRRASAAQRPVAGGVRGPPGRCQWRESPRPASSPARPAACSRLPARPASGRAEGGPQTPPP